MSFETAESVVELGLIYLLIGAAIALFFLGIAPRRVDPAMQGMSFWTRLILLPGLVLLWPLMTLKLIWPRSKS